MTMIELGMVMGIVSLLLALVLGLSRHVDASVKIRRAQADLAEWHASLDRWFLRFGEYPHARIDTTGSSSATPVYSGPLNLSTPSQYPLTLHTNETQGAFIKYPHPSLPYTNIAFRSFLTTSAPVTDPWGTPYIYIPSPNAQSCTLFSCGPDRKSAGIPTGTPATPDPTLDDIHLER
jgi:type II secretory pathway pseudopilin PulG